jgi:hypothetical protein
VGTGTNAGGSSTSDEEWERFLQDSKLGAADSPKEPSARARQVTRRLGAQQPPQGWRTHTPVHRRSRRLWPAVRLFAVLALLGLALFPNQILGLFRGDTSSSAPLAPETAYPDQAPPAQKSLRPTLAEPFRGSPAAQWSNGSAGITLPAAKATGWMSAAQVGQALDASRTFLVASTLDPHVLCCEGSGPPRRSP